MTRKIMRRFVQVAGPVPETVRPHVAQGSPMDGHSDPRLEQSQCLSSRERCEVSITHPVAITPNRQEGKVKVKVMPNLGHAPKEVCVTGKVDRHMVAHDIAQAGLHGPGNRRSPTVHSRQDRDFDIIDLNLVPLNHFVHSDTGSPLQKTPAATGSDDGDCGRQEPERGYVSMIVVQMGKKDDIRQSLRQQIQRRILPMALQEKEMIPEDGIGQHADAPDIQEHGSVPNVVYLSQ